MFEDLILCVITAVNLTACASSWYAFHQYRKFKRGTYDFYTKIIEEVQEDTRKRRIDMEDHQEWWERKIQEMREEEGDGWKYD